MNKTADPIPRIAPRYVFEGRIKVRLRRVSGELVVEAWARDIGESGLGAFSAFGLVLGEEVTIEIPLPTSKTLVVPARVARCLGTQYGFQFTALSTEQRADILATVKDRPEIVWVRH